MALGPKIFWGKLGHFSLADLHCIIFFSAFVRVLEKFLFLFNQKYYTFYKGFVLFGEGVDGGGGWGG